MTKLKSLDMKELQREFDEFAAHEWGPDEHCFYDGPMEPLTRWAQREQDILMQEIDQAGGLDAWSALHAKADAQDKQAA